MIMRVNKKRQDTLKDEFLEERGQSKQKSYHAPKAPGYKSESQKSFERRYANLNDRVIADFSTLDLVYYFKETAKKSGNVYMVANITKDRAIMKRLLEDFTSKEVTEMIDFMYLSNQDYLDKSRLTVNVLGSGWVNTIYADSRLWVKGEYSPKKKGKESVGKKEWSGDRNEIGVIL